MKILSVKKQIGGWLVNDKTTVTDVEGAKYRAEVLEYIANGGIVEPEFTATELQVNAVNKMLSDGETIAKEHIQEPIAAYNKENGVSFDNAHSCANYKDEADYVHQPFCLKAWNFNVTVWKAVRLIQDDVISGNIPQPTADEFKAMLPAF